MLTTAIIFTLASMLFVSWPAVGPKPGLICAVVAVVCLLFKYVP